MADFGSPVAGAQTATNPIQTLSGVLGLKQQQQALQQGTLGIQKSQADVQMAQQTARQRQAIAGVDWGKYVDDTGVTSVDKMLADPSLRQAAGDQFQTVLQAGGTIRSQQIQNKQAIAGLNETLRKQFGDVVGSLRTDPDVVADNSQGRQKVMAAMQQFAQAGGPDAARVAQIYGPVAEHAPPGKLSRGLSNIQLQAMDAATQASKQAPSYLSTGGTQQNVNPQAAGGSLGNAQPITNTLPPTTTTVGPGGQQFYTGAPPGGRPGTVAATPLPGQTEMATSGAQDVAQHYAGVQAESQRAATFTGIARNVQQFAHSAITGTPQERANMLNGMLAYIGLPPAQDAKTASDLLQKNMSQLNLQGNTSTDFKAMVTQMAQPHMEMSEDAIKRAAGQLIGQVQMKQAIGTALTPEFNHAQQTGDQTLYRAKRDAISKVADARVWEFNSLPPAEQKKFRAGLSPQDDAELGQKYKAAKALGLLQ